MKTPAHLPFHNSLNQYHSFPYLSTKHQFPLSQPLSPSPLSPTREDISAAHAGGGENITVFSSLSPEGMSGGGEGPKQKKKEEKKKLQPGNMAHKIGLSAKGREFNLFPVLTPGGAMGRVGRGVMCPVVAAAAT